MLEMAHKAPEPVVLDWRWIRRELRQLLAAARPVDDGAAPMALGSAAGFVVDLAD
jgi:hypothetical protein